MIGHLAQWSQRAPIKLMDEWGCRAHEMKLADVFGNRIGVSLRLRKISYHFFSICSPALLSWFPLQQCYNVLCIYLYSTNFLIIKEITPPSSIDPNSHRDSNPSLSFMYVCCNQPCHKPKGSTSTWRERNYCAVRKISEDLLKPLGTSLNVSLEYLEK